MGTTSGPWTTPHTPGPWISHDTDEGEWVVDLPDALHASVTRLHFGDMETNTGTDIANANLVAAAPDLLAVVRQVFDLHEASVYEGYLRPSTHEHGEAVARVEEILDQARAAINKATGGLS